MYIDDDVIHLTATANADRVAIRTSAIQAVVVITTPTPFLSLLMASGHVLHCRLDDSHGARTILLRFGLAGIP